MPKPTVKPTKPTNVQTPLQPFWTTNDGRTVRLYHGDVISILDRLPEKSVQCVVTSPPYWGLRDYGTAVWEGGIPACDHKRIVGERSWGATKPKPGYKSGFRGSESRTDHREEPAGVTCGKCGAVRVEDNQLGSEASPDCSIGGQLFCGVCHVCRMRDVFRSVRRVLRDDATVWMNYGDTYSSGNMSGKQGPNAAFVATGQNRSGHQFDRSGCGLPANNLVGIPWRVALALQADGWILRQDIIWSKPSPMPESVRNRCTKSHEYVFLLTKSRDYFYDAEAIKDRSKQSWNSHGAFSPEGGKNEQMSLSDPDRFRTRGLGTHHPDVVQNTSNKRSVWVVSSQGYEGAHYASFPIKLITPMILAGTSEKGCCPDCGTPWERVTEETALVRDRPRDFVKYADTSHEKKQSTPGKKPQGGWDALRMKEKEVRKKGVNSTPNSVAGVDVKTVGWNPGCECRGKFEKRRMTVSKSRVVSVPGKGTVDGGGSEATAGYGEFSTLARTKRTTVERVGEDVDETVTVYVSDIPLDEHPVVPCVVCDPFVGSGTTCAVAVTHGRHGVGIDLSEKYLRENAVVRIEGELLSTPATVHLVRKVKAGRPGALGKMVPRT